MASYIYARVSTSMQAEEGESLGVQERICTGYALMRGIAIDATFIDRGVSGSTPLANRPEGSRLLAVLQPGDNIVVSKLDRMFRSASDALATLDQLRQRRIHLHLLDLGGDVCESSIAKLIFTILAAVSEAERARICERVADIKSDQRRRNRFLGGKRPFGFEVNPDGALIAIPAEQEAIDQMIALRQSGASLRKIAETVQANGVAITHETVRVVLKQKGEKTCGALSI